jgi:hypothetical protein
VRSRLLGAITSPVACLGEEKHKQKQRRKTVEAVFSPLGRSARTSANYGPRPPPRRQKRKWNNATGLYWRTLETGTGVFWKTQARYGP